MCLAFIGETSWTLRWNLHLVVLLRFHVNSTIRGSKTLCKREQLSRRSVNTCSGGGRRYFLDAGGRGGYTTAVDAEQRLPVSHLLQPDGARLAFSELTPGGGAETRIVPVESGSLQLDAVGTTIAGRLSIAKKVSADVQMSGVDSLVAEVCGQRPAVA